MKAAEDILADLALAAEQRRKHQDQGEAIRRRLRELLREAMQHPDLTMEEARKTVGLSRPAAYELAREVAAPGVEPGSPAK